MLVYDSAHWSQQDIPATLPGLIREIGILDIERMVERIQTADRPILIPVERTGTAAGPEHRNCFASLVDGTDVIVPEFKESPVEASACLARFLASAGRVCKKDL